MRDVNVILCYLSGPYPFAVNVHSPACVLVCRPIRTHWNTRKGGTAVAQWLRCCATSRKVAGLIPAGVIGIFH